MVLVADLESAPVTVICACICCGVFFRLWNWKVPFNSVSYSYDAVVIQRQYWRIISATFSHLDFMHITFNLVGSWNCRQLEAAFGSSEFARLIFILMVCGGNAIMIGPTSACTQMGSFFITAAIQHILIEKFAFQRQLSQQAVGYSCVVFGLMTVQALQNPEVSPIKHRSNMFQ